MAKNQEKGMLLYIGLCIRAQPLRNPLPSRQEQKISKGPCVTRKCKVLQLSKENTEQGRLQDVFHGHCSSSRVGGRWRDTMGS